jgi:hypothetical protein
MTSRTVSAVAQFKVELVGWDGHHGKARVSMVIEHPEQPGQFVTIAKDELDVDVALLNDDAALKAAVNHSKRQMADRCVGVGFPRVAVA